MQSEKNNKQRYKHWHDFISSHFWETLYKEVTRKILNSKTKSFTPYHYQYCKWYSSHSLGYRTHQSNFSQEVSQQSYDHLGTSLTGPPESSSPSSASSHSEGSLAYYFWDTSPPPWLLQSLAWSSSSLSCSWEMQLLFPFTLIQMTSNFNLQLKLTHCERAVANLGLIDTVRSLLSSSFLALTCYALSIIFWIPEVSNV